jgi:hypothetical protein
MSEADLHDRPIPTVPTRPRRPLWKRTMHALRRGHLYFGLFLFPWAILYGVTAFLFNHPTAFSEQPSMAFGREAIAGSELESLPAPKEIAQQVLATINAKHSPEAPYTLGDGEIKFNREFAFGTVKAEGQNLGFLVDVRSGHGTIRVQAPEKPKVEIPKAPFAVGNDRGNSGRAPKERKGPRTDGAETATVKLDRPVSERIKSAMPGVLEACGFTTGEITLTSVPDVVFPIVADGKTWIANYNPMTGTLGGKPADLESTTEIGWRRFLLRLHTAHGYPGETNARWFWAIVVDAMAFVMCFWGFTGLLMWWQIKATRRFGLVILFVSAVAATALGFAMHSAMTA